MDEVDDIIYNISIYLVLKHNMSLVIFFFLLLLVPSYLQLSFSFNAHSGIHALFFCVTALYIRHDTHAGWRFRLLGGMSVHF